MDLVFWSEPPEAIPQLLAKARALQDLLMANHTLMHAGQFTVVRRALNKPILF